MRSLSWGMQDLVPWPGIEPGPPPSLALGAQSLRHWSTREAPEDPNFIDEKNQIRTGESNLLRVSLWERRRYYIQAQAFLALNQMLTHYLFYQWILTSLVLSLSLFLFCLVLGLWFVGSQFPGQGLNHWTTREFPLVLSWNYQLHESCRLTLSSSCLHVGMGQLFQESRYLCFFMLTHNSCP